MQATIEDARAALENYRGLEAADVQPLGRGLINATFAVDTRSSKFVLQRVHPVFAPEVHLNILAVTEHLAARGVPTPRLVIARDGGAWVDQQGIWRLMTRLPGVSVDAVERPAQAHAAGGALARFHGALADLDYEFVAMRVGVHDTPRHLEALRHALTEHAGHRLYADVEPVAAEILEAAESLPGLGTLPERIVHGDPKFNNVMFEPDERGEATRAVGLVDLDTVGPMPLHLELGDAWRSWCNPEGEDASETRFDSLIFEAAVRGYATVGGVAMTAGERDALLHGVEWVTVELAARFGSDALSESYFGWDSTRFPARGEHNLLRARGQLALHKAVLSSRSERAAVLRAALS